MQAGNAAADGIRRVYPDAEILIKHLADGGEGFVDAHVSCAGGKYNSVRVTDPCGRPVNAENGIIPDSKTAIIEMSAAAGITLVPPEELDPMNKTTYGVGEMICDAISHGCRDFIIGIGGSATNDGGAGMLQALGFDLLNTDGKQISFGAAGLSELACIKNENVIPELSECRFRIACDVNNPLCGDNGCSAVFAPQKGAKPDDILRMDKWLANFAEITKTINISADPNHPGAGAAGGIGFAFLSYMDAELFPGIELILQETHLEDDMRNADIIITGEGRIDGQTAMGKAPAGVARLAKKYGKPVIAFAGSTEKNAALINEHGIDAYFPILHSICTIDEAMNPDNASRNLSDTAEQVFRLIKTFY